MDTHASPSPLQPQLSPVEQSVPQNPQPPVFHPPSLLERYKVPFAIGGIVCIIVLMTLVVAAISKPKGPVLQPTTQTTPTPTPTPVRELSAVASQSAFLVFEQSVASLSASISGLNVYDNALTPPVLDLELNFR